ncbi:MAG TPA: DUF2059 domain-containing protein [Thermoanaerobaculia bacterium]|jgi:hypothetical protein|nr:DUF2059 domain-containing protein [Thermoanaerobaculia bacterium]
MRQLTAVALLVCALPLSATDPNPSKRQSELIDQLLVLTGAEKTSHAVLDYYVDEMYKQEVAMAGDDPQALDDAKKDAARLRELMGELNLVAIEHDATAHVYAKYLSEADLEALVAFYKSPAGQRYIAAIPEISQEAMKAGGEKLGPKFTAIIQQVAQEREQRHPWERTMRDMRTIATAVEAYATDENKYPPESELKKVLVPTYIKELPEKDGWGNAYYYEASTDGQHYRVASAGADNNFAWDTRKITLAEGKEPKYSDDLGEDIIYQDGTFIQAPSVTKPKPRPSAAPRDAATAPAARP